MSQTAPHQFNITDFGAISDTTRLSTTAINKAIEACSKTGGGRVLIPPGNFKSGTITLLNNTELYLERGAVLYGSTDPRDYPRQRQPLYRSQKDPGGWYALIYAEGKKNIGITGFGTIDGQGARQFPANLAKGFEDRDGRPRNILFISCRNIAIENITLLNSGIWNQHYLDCENISIDHIRVYNHSNRNNDGIDLDGCRHATLSNSILDSDDDCITLKSTGISPCEDIVIDNCIASSFCNAIKCGTESTGGFKNIMISNCIVKPSACLTEPVFKTSRIGQTGISLEITDGGTMDGVIVNNIMIEGTECPIFVRLANRARKHTDEAPTPPQGSMRNISISNITAYNTGNLSSSITGIPGARIENITLDHIRITNKGGVKEGEYIGDLTKVPELPAGYPDPTKWGNLPSYGFFIRHVKEISLSDIMLRSVTKETRQPIVSDDAGIQFTNFRTDSDTPAPPDTSASPNLVTNPGFEEGQDPWQLDNWMKNDVLMERDSKNPHSGNWSMKVQLVKALNLPVVTLAFPHLPLRPGSDIQVRFWARGVSNGANLTVMVRKEIEPRISYLRTEMNLTDEWQEHIYTIQLPSDVIAFVPSLRFVLNQPGVCWIDDVSIVELPPMDNGPVPTINPIRNPSFEAGTDGWTATFRRREFGTPSQESGNGIPAPDDARLETATDNTAPAGQRFLSVKIDPGCRSVLTSAYFPARYGHKGLLHFFLRSDGVHPFDAGIGSGVNSSSSIRVQPQKTSATWQQFTLPVTLRPAQDGVYFVCLRFNEPGNYDLDAVSFTEEEHPDITLYPSATSIQAVAGAPIANLYALNDPASFKLVMAGEQPGFSTTCQIDILNYREEKIGEVTVPVAGNEKGYGETIFKTPTQAFGAFRLEAHRANSRAILAEQIYSVLPSLPPPGDRPDSYFGGHVDLSPYNLEIARKAGYRWLRMWPPLLTTWIAGEPKPGIWNFPTDVVARAARQGFQLSGILGTAPDFKADIDSKSSVGNRWSHGYPPGSLTEWKEYVARCTNAFYPYIHTWEIWNEPDGGYLQVKPGTKKAEIYLSLLKAAREVLDSVAKPITLMGPAVANINTSLGWEVLQQGGGRWMDAFSFHFYSLAAGGDNPDDAYVLPLLQKFRTYRNRLGEPMPLWHSEGGMYLQGAQSWLPVYRIPSSSPAKKQFGAASMVRAALFFKAMGVKHYFDFELTATAAGQEINGDMTAGFIEVTGIPGPGIAAHAAMVAITEDTDPAGFDDFPFHSARVKVAHFKKATATIDVYWSDRATPLKESAKLKPTDKVLDMMGNPVAPEAALTGEFPLYIIRTKEK
jgi:hypothetical protein